MLTLTSPSPSISCSSATGNFILRSSLANDTILSFLLSLSSFSWLFIGVPVPVEFEVFSFLFETIEDFDLVPLISEFEDLAAVTDGKDDGNDNAVAGVIDNSDDGCIELIVFTTGFFSIVAFVVVVDVIDGSANAFVIIRSLRGIVCLMLVNFVLFELEIFSIVRFPFNKYICFVLLLLILLFTISFICDMVILLLFIFVNGLNVVFAVASTFAFNDVCKDVGLVKAFDFTLNNIVVDGIFAVNVLLFWDVNNFFNEMDAGDDVIDAAYDDLDAADAVFVVFVIFIFVLVVDDIVVISATVNIINKLKLLSIKRPVMIKEIRVIFMIFSLAFSSFLFVFFFLFLRSFFLLLFLVTFSADFLLFQLVSNSK